VVEAASHPGPASAAADSCAQCGLPARGGDRFCCYGCELAHEISRDAAEDHARTKDTLTFALLLVMTLMMFSLFLYAEDIYGAGEDAGLVWMRKLYRGVSVLLATPVMAMCGLPLARHAARRLAERQLSMEALIALGSFTAYGLSLYSLLRGGRDVYLDSAATSLVLATLGRYLEASARSKASGVIGPSVDAGNRPVMRDGAPVPANALRPGDRIELEPEQVLPVDVRLAGRDPVDVDLGVLSGESAPVTVRPGELVCAGAVPVSGPLSGEVLRIARESTVERLAELARSLREAPSFLMKLADALARVLTPLAALLALGTLLYWSRVLGLERGVVNALSVVLVACPCSYAIATPLVHWLAMRRALRAGVLVRNAEALERIASIEQLAFDKTGTLTDAELAVSWRWFRPGVDVDEVRALVKALEERSPHPVARALLADLGRVEPAALGGRRFVAGRGVFGTDAAGRALELVGGPLPSEAGATAPDGPRPEGTTAGVVLRREGVALAAFALAERLRPEAEPTLRALERLGVEVRILSGDARTKTAAVAEALGVPFEAELGPADKVERLTRGRGTAHRGAALGMVGDGLNDAPVLAGATSFATAGATGLSRALAQVNLLREDLRLVPFTIDLARRSRRLIRRLLAASTLYNAVFLALAMAGALRPVWAGLSMLIASFLTLGLAGTVSGWPGPGAERSE
jgi:Cu2+-exporting ATPase/Cu+-exporting ATPase